MENDADRKRRTANESRVRIEAFDRIVDPWGWKGTQAPDEHPQRLLGGEGGDFRRAQIMVVGTR